MSPLLSPSFFPDISPYIFSACAHTFLWFLWCLQWSICDLLFLRQSADSQYPWLTLLSAWPIDHTPAHYFNSSPGITQTLPNDTTYPFSWNSRRTRNEGSMRPFILPFIFPFSLIPFPVFCPVCQFVFCRNFWEKLAFKVSLTLQLSFPWLGFRNTPCNCICTFSTSVAFGLSEPKPFQHCYQVKELLLHLWSENFLKCVREYEWEQKHSFQGKDSIKPSWPSAQ